MFSTSVIFPTSIPCWRTGEPGYTPMARVNSACTWYVLPPPPMTEQAGRASRPARASRTATARRARLTPALRSGGGRGGCSRHRRA
ncbi:MAG TPA: hypothetical protein VD926_04800, partial [Acidimicrobiales bacterium]|nr:hypothetical protein [Acidimicrobiales bacterium]